MKQAIQTQLSKQKLEQKHQYQEYFSSIVDTVRESLLILDGNFRVISANRSFYEKFKVKPTETENKLIYELGDGQWNIRQLKHLLEDILPTHNPFNNFKVEYNFPTIGRKIMLLNARQIKSKSIWKDRILLAIEDITESEDERIRIGELFKHNEERFRTLIEKSTDAIQLVSADAKVIYTSESIKNVLGYTPEELEGQSLAPYLHPDDTEFFLGQFQTLLNNPGSQIKIEYRVKHKNGSWAWLETTGVNHLHTPNIHALVGTFRNITDRKKSEVETRENEDRLQLALEAGEIGVWDWNIITNKIEWTDKVYEIHEVNRDQFDGKFVNYVTQIHPEDKSRVEEAVQNALANKVPYDIEFRIVTNRGNVKWVATSAKVIFENNKPIRMLGATIDITRRKELERQKDEFLGIASHELKTPVTSIKAYEQVLQRIFKNEGNKVAVEQLAKMDAQINKLTSLISDLLDVTKINSGKLITHEEEFSFNTLVNEIVDELQLTTDKHKLIKKLDRSKKVFADRERIGQVLTNLITNAIKYSPYANKIIIKTSNEGKYITVSVKDYGIGIPKDKQSRVFEQFFRVSGDKEHTFPGLGLGLYISSEIIKRQGGKIWVESIEGKGSTFFFKIPTHSKVNSSEV